MTTVCSARRRTLQMVRSSALGHAAVVEVVEVAGNVLVVVVGVVVVVVVGVVVLVVVVLVVVVLVVVVLVVVEVLLVVVLLVAGTAAGLPHPDSTTALSTIVTPIAVPPRPRRRRGERRGPKADRSFAKTSSFAGSAAIGLRQRISSWCSSSVGCKPARRATAAEESWQELMWARISSIPWP